MSLSPDAMVSGEEACAHCGRHPAVNPVHHKGFPVCHPIPPGDEDWDCLLRLIVGREELGALIGRPRPAGLDQMAGLARPGGGR